MRMTTFIYTVGTIVIAISLVNTIALIGSSISEE